MIRGPTPRKLNKLASDMRLSAQKGSPMKRLLHSIPALLMLAVPTMAEDFRTIGLIEAEFDGATLSQTTMSYLERGTRLATASLTTRSGTTTLTIQGAEGKLSTSTETGPPIGFEKGPLRREVQHRGSARGAPSSSG